MKKILAGLVTLCVVTIVLINIKQEPVEQTENNLKKQKNQF